MNEIFSAEESCDMAPRASNWDSWGGVLLGVLDKSPDLCEGQKGCPGVISILTPFRRTPPNLRSPLTHGTTCPRSTNSLTTQEQKLNDGRRRDGRKDGWMEGALGGREGQRRANADSSTVRACIHNASSLETSIRNHS